MKTGPAIADILKKEGVEYLFAYPVNHLIEACAAVDIRPIIVRQERIGLHMADAMSRLTKGRRMGVFCMQSGPGSENAYGGIAQAFGESIPLLVIPQGYPRRIAHVPPNFNSTLAMAHVAKHSEPVTNGREIVNIMRRAFSLLRNGRGSPVIVELPADAYAEDAPDPLNYEPVVVTKYGPDPAAVTEAAKVLMAAKRPVIYAGQGVHWAEAYAELKELAELLAIPVCTSLEGKSCFDETHPLALGSGGRAYPKAVRSFLDRSDVILGIG
ncbi:MAG TPA: thiamine pyrophosphate-binding protein, partial [Reyranella sp.]|nr:thiamine pyrophosphate-binding protein [Reyranella sp.]